MNAKQLFLDFLSLVFLLAMIIGCIFYFLFWGGLSSLQALLKFLIPVAGFGFLWVARMHFKRKRKKKREREGNLEVTLILSYGDKIKAEIITFGVPIVILIIPFLFEARINWSNIFQAVFAFLVIYGWNKFLFDQED